MNVQKLVRKATKTGLEKTKFYKAFGVSQLPNNKRSERSGLNL